MHRFWLAGLVAIALAARVGRGQDVRPVAEGSLDVGGAWLRQPGLMATNVVTAAGQLQYTGSAFALSSNGVAARTPDDRYTGQGVLSASRYAPAAQRFRWELTGSASAFGLSNAAPVFAWQALAREHFIGSVGSLFAGVSSGQVSQVGVARAINSAHMGGDLRLGGLARDELSAALAYTSSGLSADSLGRFRYADAIGLWTHRTSLLELSAAGGVRVNARRAAMNEPWASASAVLWMTERAAVVFAAGRALEDVARGVPSVRYLSLSLRIGARPGALPAVLRVRREHAEDDGGRLDVRGGDDSLRVVSVRLPSATTVEIMGDFTDWEPVPMTRTPNGEWRVERVITPGTHRVAIRIDAGAWTVPPNLPRVDDEFGGDVGIVIVP